MNRVLVIGSGGAGKSTFARRLADATGLPLIHLDREYWQPGWRPTPVAAWAARIAELVAQPRWIIDGNFGASLRPRLEACDTVILLSASRWRCLYRVVRRRLVYWGHARPDLDDGCPERLTLEFLLWIWSYPRTSLPRRLEALANLRPDQKGLVLRNNPDIEEFFARSLTSKTD